MIEGWLVLGLNKGQPFQDFASDQSSFLHRSVKYHKSRSALIWLKDELD